MYGTTMFKNGKKWGKLEFNTGKVIVLKPREVEEFENAVEYYQLASQLKEKERDKSIQETPIYKN